MTCKRGDGEGTKVLLTIAGIILIGGFLILVVVLLLFTHHVYREERTWTIPAREIGKNFNRSTALRGAQRSDDSPDQEPVAQNQIEEDNANTIERRKKNKFILTKQALLQSFLYILGFFSAWLSPIILIIQLNFTDIVEEQAWRFWLGAIITPLTGVFNILIYTRPKVLKLKETLPNAYTFELLLVIIFSGGEIPSMADILQATTTRRQHHGEEVQGEEVHEGQFEDDKGDDLSEEASSAVSSNSLISYDLDVSSEVEILSRMKESDQSLISVMRQRR